MTFRFQCRRAPSSRIDLSDIALSSFLGKKLRDVARMRLPQGLGEIGDWFEVTGDTESAKWVFEGTGHWLDGVASGLASGEVVVDGDVGNLAGTGMRGGELHILGSAGDYIGGPRRGERTGMRGGLITIGGDAGSGVGHRLRRGTIVVHSGVGELCGWDMVAGTIVVGGEVGEDLGFAMRRGTVVLLRAEGLTSDCELGSNGVRFSPWMPMVGSYPTLLGRGLAHLWQRTQIGREGQGFIAQMKSLSESTSQWKRAIGDRMAGGMGEVLARSVG